MKNKFYFSHQLRTRAINQGRAVLIACIVAGGLTLAPKAAAWSDAPPWMHALVNAPLPVYGEKVEAVLLYSETNVTVLSADKIKTQVREAYKILRPKGRDRGTVQVYFNPQRKIKNLHGWCIPAQGKDYEVKDKDAIDRSLVDGDLANDSKFRLLIIPAPDPGNIVGYEFEVEEQPFYLQDIWSFQEEDPVLDSRYSLQLPPGWEFKVSWLNHAEVKAVDAGNNRWQWEVKDVKDLRKEHLMPPMSGVSGQMVVSFYSAETHANVLTEWNDLGKWYGGLTSGRTDPSPQIKQEVITLTASKTSPVLKMRALAEFVQHDIRYVAIELGIGGFQPHAAPDVFSNHYGDCKDKATLMRSMLKELGIESYYVVINNRRGAVTRDTPPHSAFNHVVTAIKLPAGLSDPSLVSTWQHPKLGQLLFFDPTDEMTPFGQINGALQDNYALLVTPEGGELVDLPQQPSKMNSIERTGKLVLDPTGKLKGEVKEVRLGGRAWSERWQLRTVSKDTDQIKPIENLLSGSLSNFHITHASVINLQHTEQPFGFEYSFESDNYAKNAGTLLLVRPRVLGNKAEGFLETKEPRIYAIEFDDGPTRDTDSFEITLPPGYEVDDVPPPVDADYAFASYHSKTEVKGNVIDYTRTFEVKQLSVPVAQADDLKKFYRTIAGDERNTVVLKAAK